MLHKGRIYFANIVSFVTAGSLVLAGNVIPVHAGEADATENRIEDVTDTSGSTDIEDVTGTSGSTDIEDSTDTGESTDEEENVRVLLPSAGFSYSFSANKVSLRDVEDNLYENGIISEKKTTEKKATNGSEINVSGTNGSRMPALREAAASVQGAADVQEDGTQNAADTADTVNATDGTDAENSITGSSEDDDNPESPENRAIAVTALTAVQKQEQAVVQAVSQTQGIVIDNATATILSATAVTVVSDANTAVSLAKLADKKETQAKLDQGVITAGEAEALMATNKASTSISVNVGGTNADGNSDGTTEVVISIDPGTGDSDADVSGIAGDGTDGEAGADTAPATDAGAGNSVGEEITESAGGSSAGGSDSITTSSTTAATDSEGNELVVAQVNDYINIRSDADQESDIVGKLYNGSVAKVLGRTGNGWARIESGDVKGYIREEYVATGETAQELADSVSTKQAVVTTETLRVRAAAEGDSDVITLIGQGEALDILGEENGWYKISTPDGEGYISSDFADVEAVYPEAVSKQQEEAEEAARKAEEEAAAKAASEAAEKAAEESGKSSSGSESSSTAGTGSSTGTESSGSAETSSSSSSSGSGNALNSYTGSSSSGTSTGQAVVNYALQFLGNPYVWGGSSLTNGTDCSGFTMAVYANFGYSLPHYTGSQESCGTAVASLADAQPGDLILYDGHVGIYMGNNQIVHASNPRTGITTGTATYRHIVAIRRIIN